MRKFYIVLGTSKHSSSLREQLLGMAASLRPLSQHRLHRGAGCHPSYTLCKLRDFSVSQGGADTSYSAGGSGSDGSYRTVSMGSLGVLVTSR